MKSSMDIFPSYEIFKSQADIFPRVPLCAEILGDLETPVSAFLKVRKGSYSFLLESAEQEERTGRYSFLGTSPDFTVRGKGREVEIYNNLTGEKKNVVSDNPTGVIDGILKDNRAPAYDFLPGFTGGLIGYFSYDFVRQIERIPDRLGDDLDCPDFFFLFAGDMVVFDHFKRKIILVSNIDARNFKSPGSAYENGMERLALLKKNIEKPLFLVEPQEKPEEKPFKSNFKRKDFIKSVKAAKKHIKEGDIIQTVLSQRWERKLDTSPFSLYRALRSVNPSPYMFFLEAGEVKLVGSSPEILVKLDGGAATVRPIAGTRPRGRNAKEEKKMEKSLLEDEKERAEHIMLVDLGRNDLGRVCRPGSVKVTELMAVEKYSHVMHLVSNVEGTLKPGKKATDLLKASFPAGTVSGAPKIRAMEIIEELEPSKRGPYAGAAGYFSLQGNMDFCITIRTVTIKDDRIYIQAGAGIVADSVPEKEFAETKNKAKGLMEACRVSRNI